MKKHYFLTYCVMTPLFFAGQVRAVNFEEALAQKGSTVVAVHFINEQSYIDGDVKVHVKAGRFPSLEKNFPLRFPHQFLTSSFSFDHFQGDPIALRVEFPPQKKFSELHLVSPQARSFEVWIHLTGGGFFVLTESHGFSSQ